MRSEASIQRDALFDLEVQRDNWKERATRAEEDAHRARHIAKLLWERTKAARVAMKEAIASVEEAQRRASGAYHQGHHDARMVIDRELEDPGKGSMGDLQYSIRMLRRDLQSACSFAFDMGREMAELQALSMEDYRANQKLHDQAVEWKRRAEAAVSRATAKDEIISRLNKENDELLNRATAAEDRAAHVDKEATRLAEARDSLVVQKYELKARVAELETVLREAYAFHQETECISEGREPCTCRAFDSLRAALSAPQQAKTHRPCVDDDDCDHEPCCFDNAEPKAEEAECPAHGPDCSGNGLVCRDWREETLKLRAQVAALTKERDEAVQGECDRAEERDAAIKERDEWKQEWEDLVRLPHSANVRGLQLLAERDRYREDLERIKLGKLQEDNEHPLGEWASMAMRFINIAREALNGGTK